MKTQYLVIAAAFFASCSNGNHEFDAQGNFEAIEVIVSAESNGKIINLPISEGDVVEEGHRIGLIDTVQLDLKRIQLIATIKALEAKVPDIAAQINVLKEQLKTAQHEQHRTKRLVETQSATQKQLDDQTAQVALIERQITATTAQLGTQARGILAEIEPLKAQIAQIDDQIDRCKISAPISGTILTKFVEQGEVTANGKPLFKLANLKQINLKAYLSGAQLSALKIGQQVTVYTDKPEGAYNQYSGRVIWISDKAEFTPKVIQTKEERSNLVYAFKVVVENDGSIKIGMPGEVKFKER